MRRWSAATSSIARAGSMRQSARTRPCSPISFAGCLRNGANTSFVNRIADASVSIDDLVADPAEAARSIQPIRAPPEIAAPRDLYAPDRVNSRGLDLSDESRLAKLDSGLNASAEMAWRAFPPGATEDEPGEPVLNPADLSDIVGFTRHARADEIAAALDIGDRAALAFAAIPPSERADLLAPCRRHSRGAERPARRPHRPRGRQVLRQCGRGSPRGCRLPALLRP